MPLRTTDDQHAESSVAFLLTNNDQLEMEKGISFERVTKLNKEPRKDPNPVRDSVRSRKHFFGMQDISIPQRAPLLTQGRQRGRCCLSPSMAATHCVHNPVTAGLT